MCKDKKDATDQRLNDVFAAMEVDLDSVETTRSNKGPSTKFDTDGVFDVGRGSQPKDIGAQYVEKCEACRGSGRFVSWSGRDVGACFKCKGKGTRTFKTSAESRAKNRTAAKDRREVKAADDARTFEEWSGSELGTFLKGAASWSDFASSLFESVRKYGSLTEPQEKAARSMMAKVDARNVERAKVDATNASDLDLSGMVSGMYAVPDGTRLKVRIDVVTKGKWNGHVFVSDGAEYGQRKRYGSQRPGAMYVGSIVEELRAIISNPFEASKAYGTLVGRCGVCGRTLEDKVSVANGIGPVCAAKFG